MSLRILFADDSMTAQNMGKKILTEAGYEVVAVSNGAAAVKKIAEHKPDIIILDVYMPGYSGLEVCEKVRASIDTLKTPVLLTVGKMEPPVTTDANRVRADGVIIKPFEASDLLAIVKKLEERIIPPAVPPLVQQTIRLERPPDFSEFAVHSTGNSSPVAVAAVAAPTPEELDENTVQPTIDVPDHMATVSAFSDLLGTDMLAPVEFSSPVAPERSVEVAPAAVAPDPSSTFTSIPEIEIPPAIRSDAEVAPIQEWRSPSSSLGQDFPVNSGRAPVLEPVPEAETLPVIEPVAMQSVEVQAIEVEPIEAASPEVEEATAPVSPPQSSAPVNSEGVYPDTQPIPAYEEPEVHTSQVELGEVSLEPVAASSTEEKIPVHRVPAFESILAESVSEVSAGIESRLEPTIQKQAEVTPAADPNLVTEGAALEAFPTRFGVQSPEEIPVGIASDFPVFHATSAGEQATVETEHIETHDVVVEPAVSSDEDFEARVAAAMNLYAEPAEAEEQTEQAQEVESDQPHSAPAAIPEDDFEARVAAAMSLYEEPQPTAAFVDEVQPPETHEATAAPRSVLPEPLVEQQIESLPTWHSRVEIPPMEAAPVAFAAEEPPSFEYSPPITEPRREPQIEITPALQTEAVVHQPVQIIHERSLETAYHEPVPDLRPVADTVAQNAGHASVSPATALESQTATK
ncbi:MAG TPA: response regulator, partial [Candidatus Angelobacter sp.]|nr:response regulator [Candidatus Angelobacter sp.]